MVPSIYSLTVGLVSLALGEAPARMPECRLEDTGELSMLERGAESGAWCELEARLAPLRCDLVGLEPLDVPGAQPGSGGAPVGRRCFRVAGARGLVLESAEAWAGRVEWREETAEGTRLLAGRDLSAAAGEVELPVAAADRMLRLFRPGSSPVSFFVSRHAPQPRATLPAPRPGGEVVVALPARRLIPERFELRRGARAVAVLPPAIQGRTALSGIPAGSYLLAPIWRGGLTAAGAEVTIKGEQTTELVPLRLPPAGAIEILLADELCLDDAPGRRLEIAARGGEVGATHARREPVWEGAVTAGECAWWLEGLPPGPYQVLLLQQSEADRSTLAWADATLEDDGVALTTLDRGGPRVTGRVSFADGEPFDRGWVVFSQEAREIETELDARGRYEIRLPSSGTYRVSVNSPRYAPVVVNEVALRRTEERLDVEVPGGVLDLSVRRDDGVGIEEVVQFTVSPVGGRAPIKGGFLRPSEAEDARIAGVGFGRHLVRAVTRDGWASDPPAEVELSQHEPRARVDLLLRRRAYRIRLIDQAGAPVLGGQVRLANVSLREDPPGEFRGDLGAPGAELRVFVPGGLAPSCRILDANETQVVILTPGVAAPWAVWLGQPSNPYVAIEGLPGSDCAVIVGPPQFPVTLRDGATWLRLPPLPTGTFSLRAGGGERAEISVPGDATAVMSTPVP